MRIVAPDNLEASLGPGFRLQRITAEVVPNGFWPVDFGGPLGEPVTRAIRAKLPWLDREGAAAAALTPRVSPAPSRSTPARRLRANSRRYSRWPELLAGQWRLIGVCNGLIGRRDAGMI